MSKFNKWQHFGTSIFTQMTKKSVAANAVNLAQGFPDFDGPEVIKEAAVEAIRLGKNQYAPSHGIPELRALLAQRRLEKTEINYCKDDETTVFSGATEAIFCAFQAFFGPKDEIIALAPFYDSYPAAAFGAGAKLVDVALTPGDWRLNTAAMEKAVTAQTKGLIINSPHNPTGRVFDDDELAFLSAFAIKHDLTVITDEVYEELVFSPCKHRSLSTVKGMRERTYVISSTSKTFSFTGWKIGYGFGPKAMTDAIRTVHQFSVFCSATPLQYGMVAALHLADDYYQTFRKEYEGRRNKLAQILKKHGFTFELSEGTYFITANYSKIRDVDDLTFADWLIETAGVATIPISAFYQDKEKALTELRYVRFGFCKGVETLEQADKNFEKI